MTRLQHPPELESAQALSLLFVIMGFILESFFLVMISCLVGYPPTLGTFSTSTSASLFVGFLVGRYVRREMKGEQSEVRLARWGVGGAVAMQQTFFLSHIMLALWLERNGLQDDYFSALRYYFCVETLLGTVPAAALGVTYAKIFWDRTINSSIACTSVIALSVVLYQYLLLGYHSDQAFAVPFEIFLFPFVCVIDFVFIIIFFCSPENWKRAIRLTSFRAAILSTLITLLMHWAQMRAFEESDDFAMVNYPFSALGIVGVIFPVMFAIIAFLSRESSAPQNASFDMTSV